MPAERPALYDHCEEVYGLLKAKAEPRIINGLTADVYVGFTTKLFKENRISVPYYTHIMNALQAMDCIRQLRRGGGSSPSEWLLMQEPALDRYRDRAGIFDPAARRQAVGAETVQQLRALNHRVSQLESVVQALLSAHLAGEDDGDTGGSEPLSALLDAGESSGSEPSLAPE